jgi:hypothetical protein
MPSDPNVRPGTPHPSWAPEGERDFAEKIHACAESFEDGIGSDFRDRCNTRYQQYRGFRKWRDEWTRSSPRDKDDLLDQGKQTWGAHLHIPLSYRTIETQVPAAIAHRPRLLYLPRMERWAENVQSVRMLIDSQQDNIDIDLPFQAVMRAGRIYGLGIGKTYWSTQYSLRRRVQRKMLKPDKFKVGNLERVKTFDDPMFDDVDPYDFFWDQFGSSMRGPGRVQWVIHRTWLSLEGVLERLRSGVWNTATAEGLSEDELRKMGGDRSKYDEIWNERMTASGLPSYSAAGLTRGEQIHEVLEWHDGIQVGTLLDRECLVQAAESPCVGDIPFVTYRPVPLQKQMVGIGDLEPLEHIQRELDTLRSQRRDAATIALAAPYAFDDGAIDEDDIVFGPGTAIRVTNARPTDALMPIPRQDVPGSSYQEEQVVRQDFDVVSGITDALNPQQGQVNTATEAQLVQASLARRIELGSRRFEIEVARNAARHFLYLDQRMILDNREDIRAPDEGVDELQAAREGRWKWVPIGPAELRGEFEIIPEGGSMAARNVPQDRQDAVQIMQLFGQHPNIDPRRPLTRALELFGIRDTQSWLKQDPPPVPPLALEMLARAGVKKDVIARAVKVAQEAQPSLGPGQQQGPNVAQVDQAMGNGGAPRG